MPQPQPQQQQQHHHHQQDVHERVVEVEVIKEVPVEREESAVREEFTKWRNYVDARVRKLVELLERNDRERKTFGVICPFHKGVDWHDIHAVDSEHEAREEAVAEGKDDDDKGHQEGDGKDGDGQGEGVGERGLAEEGVGGGVDEVGRREGDEIVEEKLVEETNPDVAAVVEKKREEQGLRTSFFVGVAVYAAVAERGRVELSHRLLDDFCNEQVRRTFRAYVDGMDLAVDLLGWDALPDIVWRWQLKEGQSAAEIRRSTVEAMQSGEVLGLPRIIAQCEGAIATAQDRSSHVVHARASFRARYSGADDTALRRAVDDLLPCVPDDPNIHAASSSVLGTLAPGLRGVDDRGVDFLPGIDEDEDRVPETSAEPERVADGARGERAETAPARAETVIRRERDAGDVTGQAQSAESPGERPDLPQLAGSKRGVAENAVLPEAKRKVGARIKVKLRK
jgi:hypothetical protein